MYYVLYKKSLLYSTSHYGKPKGGNKGQCGLCGKAWHSKDENRPARKSTCNKVGHWSRVCKSRQAVSEVTEQTEQQQQFYFLGAVSKAGGSPEHWAVDLLLDSTPVDKIKIDTGADVNVICEET